MFPTSHTRCVCVFGMVLHSETSGCQPDSGPTLLLLKDQTNQLLTSEWLIARKQSQNRSVRRWGSAVNVHVFAGKIQSHPLVHSGLRLRADLVLRTVRESENIRKPKTSQLFCDAFYSGRKPLANPIHLGIENGESSGTCASCVIQAIANSWLVERSEYETISAGPLLCTSILLSKVSLLVTKPGRLCTRVCVSSARGLWWRGSCP